MDSLIKGLKLPTDDFGIELESSCLIPTDSARVYVVHLHSVNLFSCFQTPLVLTGVWLWLIADEGLRSILMLYRWNSGVWRSKGLVSVTLSKID